MNQGYYNEENEYIGSEETIYVNEVEIIGGKVDSVMVIKSNYP
ncbi:hypothetical protein ACWEYQ_01840 [Staphylococcus xylosus]